MKINKFILLFVGSSLLACSVLATTEYTSAEGRFSAVFQTAPETKMQTVTDKLGDEIAMYTIGDGTDEPFYAEVIIYGDYPASRTIDLRGAEQGVFKSVGVPPEDVKDENKTMNGRVWLSATATQVTPKGNVVYFWSGTAQGMRLYQVIVLTDDNPENAARARAFLQSVRIKAD